MGSVIRSRGTSLVMSVSVLRSLPLVFVLGQSHSDYSGENNQIGSGVQHNNLSLLVIIKQFSRLPSVRQDRCLFFGPRSQCRLSIAFEYITKPDHFQPFHGLGCLTDSVFALGLATGPIPSLFVVQLRAKEFGSQSCSCGCDRVSLLYDSAH